MNVEIAIFGVAAILLSCFFTEIYIRLIKLIINEWWRLLLCLLHALIIALPMVSMEYMVNTNEYFTRENQRIPLVIWLAGLLIYAFILRRKEIVKAMGRKTIWK